MATSPTSIMADSNAESSMATHLMVANAKRQNLRQTLESVHSQWQDLEEYFHCISDAIAKRMEEAELKSQQIEWKRKYIDKKSSEIDLKEKKLEERLRMADDRCKEIDATYDLVARCYGVVKQREMCCDDEWERIRCKKERLRKYERRLRRKFKREESKLEAKELMVDKLEHELTVRKEKAGLIERQLLVRLEEVELKEKRVDERIIDLERRGKLLGVKLKQRDLQLGNVENVKIERLGECDDGDEMLVDQSYADIKINVTMDGRALQMFLNGRVNDHEILRDEIIAGLRLSSDPAKLVLDAILGFYPEELENGHAGFDLIVVRKSCILLLEQLIKMKSPITTRVRDKAMRVAMQWKGKMKIGDVDHYLEVVGFLQLIATYGLTYGFDKDELLLLFEGCTCHDQAPELCRSLGLTDDIHGVIQNLIIRDLPFDAIRLIYAFELVDIFPPAPILKAHLASMIAHAEHLYRNGDPFVETQIKCIKMKLAALVSVVKCIEKYSLDCDYPVQPLVQLISELKMLKSKYKTSGTTLMAQEGTDIQKQCMISTPISSSVKETTSLPVMQPGSDSSSPVDTNKRLESTVLRSPPSCATDTEPLTPTISDDSCSISSHSNSISPLVASTMITPNSAVNPGRTSDAGSLSSLKFCQKSTTQKNKRPRLASACDSGRTLQPANPHLLSLPYVSRPVYMLPTRSHTHSGCYLPRYYPYC